MSVTVTSEHSATYQVAGITGAPGIGIGTIHIVGGSDLPDVVDQPCTDIEAALEEWRRLREQVGEQFRQETAALSAHAGDAIRALFDAYQLLLQDPTLGAAVESRIRAGNWLPGALRQAISHYGEQFLAMQDPYLRARHEDLQHLGNQLLRAWQGNHPEPRQLEGPVILVGAEVSISDIAAVPAEQLAGIICFKGSPLSHTSVVANAMGIAAVVATGKPDLRRARGLAIVDGYLGQVFIRPDPALLEEYRAQKSQDTSLARSLAELKDKPAITLDGTHVTLLTNTGLMSDVTPGLRNGAEGVGLYRTEIPFMVSAMLPSEEEQVNTYRQVLDAYAGKPVCLRVIDIGSDKQLPYLPMEQENNPALGWRGMRFALDNPSLLLTQVRAILRAAGQRGQTRVLLPMVSSREELDSFKALLDRAMTELAAEGCEVLRPSLGIMVEIPAAISQLPAWSREFEFLSIGSNDLSQYLLAVDRNNARVSSHYDHVHPAVLAEIDRIIRLAGEMNKPVSLCGEMASDPVAVVLLTGMGLRTLSMSATRIPEIKWLIRSLSISTAEALYRQTRKLASAREIRQLVEGALLDMGLEKVLHRHNTAAQAKLSPPPKTDHEVIAGGNYA
jgi:phosphotransferase system enzyme I (PtsI)/phosphotransferase system enzyme I (PtsP)